MILPDFILPSRVNQCWTNSGMDHIQSCLDKEHFEKYPWPITYNYNSRGFRDHEWPDSMEELKNAIWCLGDSFTVGIGSPLEHTWPWQLQKQTGRRVINVSLDGASNNWIARRVAHVQKEIDPTNIVIMWSYLHRRENPDQTLDDEQRRTWIDDSPNNPTDLDNFKSCIDLIKVNNSVTQLAIPEYRLIVDDKYWNVIRGSSWPLNTPATMDELYALPEFIQKELKDFFKVWADIETALSESSIFSKNNIIETNRLDLARDGHHFDLITAQWVADQIVNRLK